VRLEGLGKFKIIHTLHSVSNWRLSGLQHSALITTYRVLLPGGVGPKNLLMTLCLKVGGAKLL
jgi:hypothetical protein